MGIDGSNNSNRLARSEALRQAHQQAQSKSDAVDNTRSTTPDLKQNLPNNSKKPNLFSSYKAPSFVEKEDKAQASKSSIDLANARGSDELDTAWAFKGADQKSMNNGLDDSTLSGLAQIGKISDNAIERSGLLKVSFDLEES